MPVTQTVHYETGAAALAGSGVFNLIKSFFNLGQAATCICHQFMSESTVPINLD